jgi:hypothetical protein
MQRVPVDSSSFASIGYEPEQRVLELEFRESGEFHQYFDVPAAEYTAFLAADSKGTYLNVHFKPRQYAIIESAAKSNSSAVSTIGTHLILAWISIEHLSSAAITGAHRAVMSTS